MHKLLLFFLLIIPLLSCNRQQNTRQISDHRDSIKDTAVEQDKRMLEREERDIFYLLDSICRSRALDDVLNKVYKNRTEKNYYLKYEYSLDTVIGAIEGWSIPVWFKYGNLFSSAGKHLIISRHSPFYNGAFIDVYKFQDNGLQYLMGINERPVVTDTIRDINGDGLKDLDIWWYPMSGCCRRNVHTVFLQKSDGTFTQEYEFINPNFYPEEKLVRGVTYGYESQLYKYKWNGLNVDTLEFVFRTAKHADAEKFEYYRINSKGDTSQIKSIPKEYFDLDDLDSLGAYTYDDED